MVALMIEGWEAQGLKKSMAPATGSVSYGVGRHGGSCLQSLSGTAGVVWFTPVNPASVIVGCAWKTPAVNLGSGNGAVCGIWDGAGVGMSLHTSATGQLQIRRGIDYTNPLSGSGTVIASSSAGVVTADTWHFIEMKITPADSGGTCIVRVNGAEVINFTGDTRGGTSSVLIGAVSWYCGNGTTNRGFVDDCYVHDTTGTVHNDFRGDFKIEGRVVNGNGVSSQLIGSDGNSIDNYLLLDELPASMTDYAQSSTIGQRDLYTVEDLVTASGAVLDIQVDAFVQKSDAGSASVNLIERLSSGTERETGTGALPGSALWVTSGPKATDPENAAWTISSVNSLQIGMEVA